MSLHPRSAIAVGIYAVVALMAANLIVMLSGGRSPSAVYAQPQPAIAGGAGVFVMPAQIGQNMWGCYLLDVDAGTLCVYQYFPGAKQLQLLSARNYKFDRRLENFNTSPSPAEIEELVKKQNANKAAANNP